VAKKFTILLLKKGPKQHGQGQKLSCFQGESYEIVKIFGGFGQIFSLNHPFQALKQKWHA
jgi:hypothetical protein